ncbi:glycosyltransferase family 1 protein [Synechococcus sp. CS-1332]|uniref:glycosyltransferase family 4 protein n=1 Tax=Synechococcus sp. CS-1332 TaxID=2847972 RepID=UPI00223AC3A8|nr:glycosyltransferase family 1 protein [Synechococcus sp. CS-1332]MCT0208302.1 glycosyltransferase family 4 protein [Synechococcus sp. CS-1332]
MRVLLVGNYIPDKQRSMERYAQILRHSLSAETLHLTLLRPPVVMLRLPVLPQGLRKWFGYIDKYLFFPPLLRLRASSFDLVHICDHSNAVYHPFTGSTPCLITCHDMLAIRGGLGDDEACCEASWLGRQLQRWILRSLAFAPFLAFVSEFTCSDFVRLTRRGHGEGLRVVLNPLNAPFFPASDQESLRRAQPELLTSPYLLMVGSSLPRKNRETAIRLLKQLADRWDGVLVIAGAPLSSIQRALAVEQGVMDRIREMAHPDHALLNALYSHAHGLLFPSLAEGFGWPVIEAQQCECPVICSNVTAVPEVAGEGAIVCAPDDLPAMAAAVLRLRDPIERRKLIAAGRANLVRFDQATFREEYLSFYRHIQTAPP